MEWITKLDLGQSYESKKALQMAKDVISAWGKENGIKCTIVHNATDGKNRVLLVETANKFYTYKMVVSSYNKIVGQEERPSLFGGTYMTDVYEKQPTFYCHLQRYNVSGIGSNSDNYEEL